MTNSEIAEKAAVPKGPGAPPAPKRASANKTALHTKKSAPRRTASKKTLKSAKRSSRSPRAANAVSGRAGSKSAKILDLIRRATGATLADLMKATGWQPHSIRGFLSTASKRYHLKIESSKNGAGPRVYRIVK